MAVDVVAGLFRVLVVEAARAIGRAVRRARTPARWRVELIVVVGVEARAAGLGRFSPARSAVRSRDRAVRAPLALTVTTAFLFESTGCNHSNDSLIKV